MSLNVRLTAPSARWVALVGTAPRTVLAALCSRSILLVLLMLAAGALAYRVPYRAAIKVGGYPPVTEQCYTVGLFDWPYLLGFNADPEFYTSSAGCREASAAYRWAFGDAAIVVPGTGYAPREFRLGVLQGQPERPVVLSTWSSHGVPLLAVPIEQAPRVYSVLLPAADGIDVAFRTPTYQGPNDPRELAFAVDAAWSEPLARSAPAWGILVPLGLTVGLAYLGLRRAGVGERWATLAGIGSVAALAVLLAVQRTAVTLLAGRLPSLVLATLALVLALAPLCAGLARRLGVVLAGNEARAIAGLIALAWLVRCLGLLHPQALTSDLGLNENNLKHAIQGHIFGEENLPAEAGGGSAPYPPAQYVMLQPLTLFGLSSRTLLLVANALIDSLVIGALWLMLRAAGFRFAEAVFAGALYVFAEPLLSSLSIGEMANVWGQALATFAVAALVCWREARVTTVVPGVVLTAALLGHLGVFASLVAFLATLGALLLLGRQRDWLRYAFVVGAAGAAAFALYYSAQLALIGELPPAPPPGNSLLQRIGYQVDELWRIRGLVGPLATVLGLAGAVLSWRRSRNLGAVLAAWWLSALLSWGTLLSSQQALRWEAFVYPAVALGGGVTLEALRQRGAATRLLAFGLLAVALGIGAVLWVQRIATYGH